MLCDAIFKLNTTWLPQHRSTWCHVGPVTLFPTTEKPLLRQCCVVAALSLCFKGTHTFCTKSASVVHLGQLRNKTWCQSIRKMHEMELLEMCCGLYLVIFKIYEIPMSTSKHSNEHFLILPFWGAGTEKDMVPRWYYYTQWMRELIK